MIARVPDELRLCMRHVFPFSSSDFASTMNGRYDFQRYVEPQGRGARFGFFLPPQGASRSSVKIVMNRPANAVFCTDR